MNSHHVSKTFLFSLVFIYLGTLNLLKELNVKMLLHHVAVRFTGFKPFLSKKSFIYLNPPASAHTSAEPQVTLIQLQEINS